MSRSHSRISKQDLAPRNLRGPATHDCDGLETQGSFQDMEPMSYQPFEISSACKIRVSRG
jgi:hypothetical protein